MIQLFRGLNLLMLHSSDYGQSTWQAGTYPLCLSQGQCKKLQNQIFILVEMRIEVLQIKLGVKIINF